LETDVNNCGACGVTCQGVCAGGRCETVLAAGLTGPASIATDGVNVYFATFSGVMEVPVGGGSPVTLASGEAQPRAVVTDGTSVFWIVDPGCVDCGSIMQVPVGGGSPVAIATGQDGPAGLAIDSTNVYWTTAFAAGETVSTMPKGGGAIVTLATGQTPSSVAVDATSVYWTNDGQCSPGCTGTVVKEPKGGGPTTILASGQTFPSGIAVDSANVYWEDALGALWEIPLGGGPATKLTFRGAGAIALGSGDLYFEDNGTIYRMPPGGQPFAFALGNASSIALDASHIYWTDYSAGQVSSILK
jgi:hypothetical protein